MSLETGGEVKYLRYALRPLVLGVVLFVGGLVVDLDGLGSSLDTTGAGQTGVGGVIGMVVGVFAVLALLDDVLLLGGLICFGLVLGQVGAYVRTRQALLTIRVAGGENLEIEVPEGSMAAADAVRAAVL